MNFAETMRSLQEMGTEQNVKIYRRHGAGENVFGVSFANLGKLKKKIKVDHELATRLWRSGNVDAMTLATMIADPEQLSAAEADRWLKDVRYGLLADLLGGVVARSRKLAMPKFKKWSKSKMEQTRVCGYAVLSHMLHNDADQVPDDLCITTLEAIAGTIHSSPNLARHSMNGALIGIGVYKPELRDAALAAAQRIGKVEVDHGQTSCKTPDAAAYIRKTATHYASRGNSRKRPGK